jgi:hypothetical protein
MWHYTYIKTIFKKKIAMVVEKASVCNAGDFVT